MKDNLKIHAVTIFLLLLLLISPIAGARHEAYSAASSSDEGIHSFFSDVIRDAGICLDKFVDESPDADTRASRLESGIKLAEEESRYYAVKGFESNVSRVVQPFSAPSGGVKQLTTYQLVFLTNYEILKNERDYPAYVEARTAIVKMRSGADAINSSLDRIELIELRNETSTLIFNVSDLSEKLNDVYALIDHYERLLEQYEIEAAAFEEDILVVAVSDEHPLLYEEITIHVYAKNITSLSLFIDNTTHSLKNQTSDLQKKHHFEKPGEHDIYAEGITTAGDNITSNIVTVSVTKIPTIIVLSSQYSALLNESVKISGLLVDYYDKPLHAANVSVKAGDEETNVTTDRSGSFEFNGTRSFEGDLRVSAFYHGNDTYNSSSANISIFFSRFPVSIHIEARNTTINVGETVNFTGHMFGISSNYTVPLTIFLNDTRVETLTVEKDFNFSLLFLRFSRPGTYEVYAFFPGDSICKPAKSNEVTIIITEGVDLFFYLLLILVAIFSFFAGMYERALKGGNRIFRDKILNPLYSIIMNLYTYILERKKKEPAEKQGIEVANEKQEKELQEEVPEVHLEGVDFGEAYKLLFDIITSHYGLKKSLTPRELLAAINNKNEPFTGAFRDVTAIHERVFYGGMKPVDGEEERYFNEIGDILRYFKG